MGEIQDRLARLEQKISEKEEIKTKKFRIPFFSTRVGSGKAKKGWVGVLKINENGVIDAKKLLISEQTITEDDLPRLATSQYVLKWKVGLKTYPIIILPSWSLEPFSVKKSFDESISTGMNIKGWRLIYNKMKSSVVEAKKKTMPSWLLWIIGAVVVGGIAYALFTGKI